MKWLLLLAFVISPAAFARSGGVATTSCAGCHGGTPATVNVTFNPTAPMPGQAVTVNFTISGGGSNGGFFATANGAGRFTFTDGDIAASGADLLHRRPKGASGGAVTFSATWTAPATPGGADFDVGMLLGNANGASSGDRPGEAHVTLLYGCSGATFYRDFDGDGVGAESSGTIRRCTAPMGYAAVAGDCNDDDPNIKPGATERCNAKDDNCNGQTDEGLGSAVTYPDMDGDGYGAQGSSPLTGCVGSNRASNNTDCDDTRATTHPGAAETCNSRDDDCDGRIDENAQARCGVGWCERLSPTCNAADCRPGEPQPEVCNALDDDCDGMTDEGDLCNVGFVCLQGECKLGAGVGGGSGSSSVGGGTGSSGGSGTTAGGGSGSGGGAGSAGGGTGIEPPGGGGCSSALGLAAWAAMVGVGALRRRRR